MLGGRIFTFWGEGENPGEAYQVTVPPKNRRNKKSMIESTSVTPSHAPRRFEKWHASLRHTLTLRSYSWIRFATLLLVNPNRGTPFSLYSSGLKKCKDAKTLLQRSFKALQPFPKEWLRLCDSYS